MQQSQAVITEQIFLPIEKIQPSLSCHTIGEQALEVVGRKEGNNLGSCAVGTDSTQPSIYKQVTDNHKKLSTCSPSKLHPEHSLLKRQLSLHFGNISPATFYISFKWKIIAYCDKHFIPKPVGGQKEQEKRLWDQWVTWALGVLNVSEDLSKAVDFT